MAALNNPNSIVVVPSSLLRDKSLSLNEKGLLMIMFSFLGTQEIFETENLMLFNMMSEQAVESAMSELERKGYVSRSIEKKGWKMTDACIQS